MIQWNSENAVEEMYRRGIVIWYGFLHVVKSEVRKACLELQKSSKIDGTQLVGLHRWGSINGMLLGAGVRFASVLQAL